MTPRFAPAFVLVVRSSRSPGHIRTPYYILAKAGEVERVCGPFANPEELAYGHDVVLPMRHNAYRVRFRQRDLWPDYAGSAGDHVPGLRSTSTGCSPFDWQDSLMHDETSHTHPHAHRPDVEDLPVSEPHRLEIAVRELLIEKGVLSGADLHRMLEVIDSWTPARGGRLVARAWVDPEFKTRLLTNAPAAARELGIESGPAHLVVLENTPERHNVIVCTLCSCYPKPILGIPPDWYKSRAYRSRTVREPRAVLAEFGTVLPEHQAVHVHDSTADLRYLVLPRAARYTEGMSEDELAALVTRDNMIGVTTPSAPGPSS